MTEYPSCVMPLRRTAARGPHSAALHRLRQVQAARAARTVPADIMLPLGLAIAIAVGLIALRAALWLPPLAI